MKRFAMALMVVSALVAPATALGQAPPNDNYLSPVEINQFQTPLSSEQFRDFQDTTNATVQNDLFLPEGAGGGGPEFTVCGGSFVYGKTVWYDFFPHLNGQVRVLTTGFDTVVGLVPYDSNGRPIASEWTCADDPTPTTIEEVTFNVTAGRNYSLQIGGFAGFLPADPASADSGSLELRFNYFPDRDGDGVFDSADACIDTPGTLSNGCRPPPPPPPPPDTDGDGVPDPLEPAGCVGDRAVLDSNDNGCSDLDKFAPRWNFDPGVWFVRRGGRVVVLGVVVQHLRVGELPSRARVSVQCQPRRACKSKPRTASRKGGVSFPALQGKRLRAGVKVIVRITKKGYVGRWRRYRIGKGKFLRPGSARDEGCLRPGSSRLRRSGTCPAVR